MIDQNQKIDQELVLLILNQLRKLKLLKKVQNVKADQSPTVLKYMSRKKSVDELQTPIHDVQFHNIIKKRPKYFFKTFQKMQMDPNLVLDELNEEKWSMVTNNYKQIIDKSRSQLTHQGKDPLDFLKKDTGPKKIQFLTKRQSIEYRIKLMGTPSNVSPSHESQQDPTDKYQKFYNKMGISSSKTFFSTNIKPRSPHKSQHSSKNNSPDQSKQRVHIKVSQQSLYLKELQMICSRANVIQTNLKKDNSYEINETNNKLNSIQADFDKFHQMLTTDLEKLEYIDEKQNK
ncbi:hypothetical protein pb186bvf_012962 [Paramecium bursaria]